MPPHVVLVRDWMRVIFVWRGGGIFQVHVGVLMKALKRVNVTYATLHAYLKGWRWPRRVSAPSSLFDEKRAKSSWEADQLKCSLPEWLSVLPVSRLALPFFMIG